MERTVWGEQIFVEAPSGRIALSVHHPCDAQTRDAPVILLHGLGGNRHEHNGLFTRTGAKLAENGFLCLRFDFCGNGESEHSSEHMTLDSMLADLEVVIKYARTIGSGDSLRFSLLGLSLGGLIAAYVASQNPQRTKSLVLWEPPYNLISTLKRLYGPLSLDRVRARGHMQAGLLKLNSEFVEQFKNLDCEQFVSSIITPTMLLQGEADQVVTKEDAQSWQKVFEQTDSQFELKYIEEADHAFTREEHALKVIDITLDWLLRKG